MGDGNLAAALAPDVSGPPPGVSDTAPSLGATPQPTPPTPIPPEISGARPSAPEAPVSDPLSLSMQPAQPKQPDLPRFQRTFKNTLTGMLLGLAEGNVLGMVQGAIDPQAPQRVLQQQRDIAASNRTFASARASHEIAQAASLEQQVNAFNETHQQEMERVGLGNLKSAQEAGFQLVAVTPLHGTVQENAQAAMNNLQQVKNNNGGLVPEGLLHIHAGNSNGIFTLQLGNPTAALDTVNAARRAQGMPSMTQDQFMAQSATDRAVQAKDALNFAWPTDPHTGQISQDSVTTLQNRLALVNGQPEFNGKGALLTSLQKNLNFQKAALQDEATRKTAAQVAEINATAGPQAAAAGQKAGAEAAAKFPYELKLKQAEKEQDQGFAFNPKTGQRELAAKADAKEQGFTNWTKVSQGDLEKETSLNAQLNDLQLNTSRFKTALNAMGPLSSTDVANMGHILSDPNVNSGILNNIGLPAVVSMMEQGAKAKEWNSLSPDKQQALIGALRMKNSALLFQKVSTGMGRASKEAMDIEIANMPSPIEGATVGNQKLQAFQENIDQMASRSVKLPWQEQSQDVKSRIEGQAVDQYNQQQAAKPQGKYRSKGPVKVGQNIQVPNTGGLSRVTKVYSDGTFDADQKGF